MAISGFSSKKEQVCVPGEFLFTVEEGYSPGNGSYEIHGSIHASLSGVVTVLPKTDGHGKIVEVIGRFDEKKFILPHINSIVTARVESLCLGFAKCSILCVANTHLKDEFSAILPKENVRDKDKDKVELHKSVQPGDIILARVVGVGDTQTSFLLSISEPALGVKYAVGLNGERMEPENLVSVKDIKSDYREPRKCCQVPDLNF
ncbi:hypothetical protein M3Y97_00240600 [Aphelenchoides bicaudatus]|nr:hypothetical protein M3Y97_00240600 [Aphelenchoides bicaudatus]